MAPPRPLKRQKTNDGQQPSTVIPEQVPLPETPKPQDGTTPEQYNEQPKEQQRSSWYSSWPRKAAPVTQLARESISSASTAAAEVTNQVKDRAISMTKTQRSPSLAMTLGKTKSNRSLPVDATTTKVHASPEPLTQRRSSTRNKIKTENLEENVKKVEQKEEPPRPSAEDPSQLSPVEPARDDKISADDHTGGTENTSWLNWLSRPAATSEPVKIAQPDTTTQDTISNDSPGAGVTKEPQQEQIPTTQGPIITANLSSNKRSWLQMWAAEPSTKTEMPVLTSAGSQPSPEAAPSAKVDIPSVASVSGAIAPSDTSSVVMSEPPSLPHDALKSSGWAFWSREKRANASTGSTDKPHVGELAVSDTSSEMKPRRTSINVKESERPKAALQKPLVSEPTKQSTSAPPSIKEAPATKEEDAKRDVSVTKAENKLASAVAFDAADPKRSRPSSPVPSKKGAEDVLLPPLHTVLPSEENPSLLQQLARMLYYTREPEPKHLFVVKEPPKVSSALAIGVHGYFPGPVIRSILGPPTGTSIKFADMAAEAIKRWTSKQGYECKVKTAALEGEGKISERVDLLWRLLLNWIDEIRKSDFVLVACHSQGVPVAIMLVAKLIQFGCLTTARVSICAIAGVSMGPFTEFRTKWITGSAGELFEFYDPSSVVSGKYLAALDVVLKSGVKVTFVGAIDDQLVPLESSIFAPITHPHIYRSVLIDGRVPASNFLSHLVGFILKLRNLGVQDHGLIHELSLPLAGSLYTGDGHSRIYDHERIYDLAVAFALETTSIPNVSLRSNRQVVSNSTNPYILPFAMRGILEEAFVKNDLQQEAEELLKEFDEWKPNSKALKDVKFRLEGIRSRLPID